MVDQAGTTTEGIVGLTDPAIMDQGLLAALLAAHVDEAVCLYDADDRVVGWNANYPKFFPEVRAVLRPGVAFTDTVRPLLEQQFPEARDPANLPRFLAAATERHRGITGPMTYQLAVGGRWVEMRMFPLADGKRLKIWRDVTRHRLDAIDLPLLNDAMSTLQIGIAVFDRQHRLALMNSQFFGELVGGYAIEPPQIGQPGGRPATIAQIRPALVDDEASRYLAGLGLDQVLAEPLVVETVHGRSYRVQETISAASLASIWVDITERRHLERSLTEALATEQRLRTEQRQLMALLAHEVRSPLAVISTSAQAMQRTVPRGDEPMRERVAKIDRAGRRLRDLIDSCLAEDRLDAPDLGIEPRHCGLSFLLGDLCDELAAARGRDIAFEGEEDVAITADAGLLRIAISNLIENAVKYTGDGVPVRVGLQRQPGGVVITVSDRGPGISPADVPRLFDKYFRAATTGGTAGAGLGLPIVKRIVEQHGGTVAAASGPGGSRFTIRLPDGHPA